MKSPKNYLILFLLITFQISAQNNNFEIVNDLVYWRYIYDDNTNLAKLKNNPKLEFLTDSTGYIKKTNFNDKELRELTAEFKIQIKDNRYRVSVYNVMFYLDPTTISSSKVSMQTITEYTIEKALIKNNGKIRKSYLGYKLTEILNPHLVELFKIKDYELNNDDW